MYNFQDYLKNKDALIFKIDDTKSRISELKKIGLDVDETIKKIENAKNMVTTEKISVVLVGAFSDGKTSVIAGWVNEEIKNMKISSDESSDEILCYTPNTIPEGCQIVDTPGLFGDKIGDDNGDRVLLSDKTKKYISEANLILYVVAAKNPVKDSHKECIRWILKDLDKLSSTIFVINRMDDVADLTDEDDFVAQSEIKTDNLRKKLLECGLNDDEARQVQVACISAAPEGKGIEIWHDHREEYLKRSHLGSLENMTNSILQNSKKDLIAKTGCDILNDEITKTLSVIKSQKQEIENTILPELKETLKRNKTDLKNLKSRLKRIRNDLEKELNNLKKKKLSVIRSTSLTNFKNVMELEIGINKDNPGNILTDEINFIFQNYLEMCSKNANELGEKFSKEYDAQEKKLNYLFKNLCNTASAGLKGTVNISTNAFKDLIFTGRNFLEKFNISIKFKPWQVTKMAKFSQKALPLIGAATETALNVLENIFAQKTNAKFEKQKDDINENITKSFIEINDSLNDDEVFFTTYVPEYDFLNKQVDLFEENIQKQENILKEYDEWLDKNDNEIFLINC